MIRLLSSALIALTIAASPALAQGPAAQNFRVETPPANDNSTRSSSTAYVENAFSALPVVYASRYGVVADTGTDQGPAMRAAIAAAQTRKAKLVLPAGAVSVSAGVGDDAYLTITSLMGLEGASRASRIVPLNASTKPVLLIKPPASAGGIRGMVLRDFEIGTSLGVPHLGGDGIKVDTTNTNGFVAKLLVENVGVAASSTGTGFYSFHHINDAVANLTGGMFGSTIRDSDFFAGTRFYLTGDSNNIERNIITGPNAGVDYEAVSGAATHRFVGNNITGTGGAFWIKNATQVHIEANQTEQSSSYTGTLGASIVLDGVTDWAFSRNNSNAYTHVDNILLKGGTTFGRVGDGNVLTADTVGGKSHVRAEGAPVNSIGSNDYRRTDGLRVDRALSLERFPR